MNQDFIDACNYVMPFGKFKGQRLAQIGSSDEGLKYLDWIYRQEHTKWNHFPRFLICLGAYLKHPAMGAAVEATIEY